MSRGLVCDSCGQPIPSESEYIELRLVKGINENNCGYDSHKASILFTGDLCNKCCEQKLKSFFVDWSSKVSL